MIGHRVWNGSSTAVPRTYWKLCYNGRVNRGLSHSLYTPLHMRLNERLHRNLSRNWDFWIREET